MVLVRWNPWQEMNTLQRQIDRLFEDSFASNSVANGNIAKMPAAEISETEDAVYLKLEVPGMEAKDLDVQRILLR